ncbi:hypothetical protein MRB53_023330 [Persea americana]|uniref:Uncharacterized protein n=1 Tax=Persea americana TaxID=3435 RepID=A0ACC2L9G6_PERAE|nr:hypothetical protein MRB53_023330 [Persea americana]
MSWSNSLIFALITTTFFIFSFEFFLSSATIETMTPGQSLRHWQQLTSAGNKFALGFFSPGESKNLYIAIWYNKLPTETPTVVWVANRDHALADSNGVFAFLHDGNLAVLDGAQNSLWKTNVSTNATHLVAVLLDTGNLVLRDGGTTVWQSFDYPFDTLLPDMKIEVNPIMESGHLLTSRKKDDNLGLGRFSFGVDPSRQNQLFIWYNLTTSQWRSGVWNGSYFENIPEVNKNFLFYFMKNSGGHEVYFTYSTSYANTRLVMDASGQLQFWFWYESAEQWRLGWSTGRSGCDNPWNCGPNSICTSKNSPECSCLPGFAPASPVNWSTWNWEDGCHRKGGKCGKEDKFWPLSNINIPYLPDGFPPSNSIEDCRAACLANCSCSAYAYQYLVQGRDSGCQIWVGDLWGFGDVSWGYQLVDLLYLRIASSESRALCQTCGSITIPYPLTAEEGCGDLAYRSFYCDKSTNQLYFKSLNVYYEITSINPETQTFVIKPNVTSTCSQTTSLSQNIYLNNSQPFYITNKTTVLLLNCTNPQPLPLNCNSSSPCYKYIEDTATSCLDSTKCCSYTSGGFPSTKHSVGVLNTTCSTYTSIVNVNLSPTNSWEVGLEIGWEPSQEPECKVMDDCALWPNTKCKSDGSVEGRKRCICDVNFQWHPASEQCIAGDQSQLGNYNKTDENLNKKKPTLVIVILPAVIGSALLCTSVYCLWRMHIIKKGWSEIVINKTEKAFYKENSFL